MFKNMDDDGNRKLTKDELFWGLKEKNMDLDKNDIDKLFEAFDENNDGSINYNEFLDQFRGPMNKDRMKLVMLAFTVMDVTNDGVITVADLKGRYNTDHHPKMKNGEWTAEQCLRQFLDSFDDKGDEDGVVTRSEWVDYYRGVSNSIDNDAYFDLMMRQAWKINSNDEVEERVVKKAYAKNF